MVSWKELYHPSTKMQERTKKVSKKIRHQAGVLQVTRPKARVKAQRKIMQHVGIAEKKKRHPPFKCWSRPDASAAMQSTWT